MAGRGRGLRPDTRVRHRPRQAPDPEVATTMGSRRLRPMTAADLPTLPEPCVRCTFWEASLADPASSADHLDRQQAKVEWAEAVTQHWGFCGVLALQEDTLIGHLYMAPAQYVPRLGA